MSLCWPVRNAFILPPFSSRGNLVSVPLPTLAKRNAHIGNHASFLTIIFSVTVPNVPEMMQGVISLQQSGLHTSVELLWSSCSQNHAEGGIPVNKINRYLPFLYLKCIFKEKSTICLYFLVLQEPYLQLELPMWRSNSVSEVFFFFFLGSQNILHCYAEHAEQRHKLWVSCIYNLILPVTNQRAHDRTSQGQAEGSVGFQVTHRPDGSTPSLWHTWTLGLGSQNPVQSS